MRNYKKNRNLSVSNSNIVVIDLETYKENENKVSKVYAGGVLRNDYDPVFFYIDKNTYDSNQVIYNLLDELFKAKYRDYSIYCHNFGRFDSIFILKALLDWNKNNEDNVYKIKHLILTLLMMTIVTT